MNFADRIVKELEAIEELKRSLKARAMIYQVDAKEHAAAHNGLPFNAYYDLSYEEWAPIRDKWLDDVYGGKCGPVRNN